MQANFITVGARAGFDPSDIPQVVKSFRGDLSVLMTEVMSTFNAALNNNQLPAGNSAGQVKRILNSSTTNNSWNMEDVYYFPGQCIALSIKADRDIPNNKIEVTESIYTLEGMSSNESVQLPEELIQRVGNMYQRKMQIIREHSDIAPSLLDASICN